MHVSLVISGLPGPGYHGGAMTCWTIIKQLKACGNDVTVISLFDTSPNNLYLANREEQIRHLESLGVAIAFVDYDSRELTACVVPQTKFQKLTRLLHKYFNYKFEEIFPWHRLRDQTEAIVHSCKPDIVISYHFDALAASYSLKDCPVLFMAGDLWHVPPYFSQVQIAKTPLEKLLNYIDYLPYKFWSSRYLKRMLRGASAHLTFPPQYVAWYHSHGIRDMEYFRTPIFDPIGPRGALIKAEHRSRVPRILLIGDLSGTSTRSGFNDFVTHVLPRLDATFGPDGFEVHILGGGTPPPELRKGLAHPAVKCMGRVVPADDEFLAATMLLVPNSITLGIRIRIITAFSFATCVVAHEANQAGIPELEDGKNCLLAQHGPALASAVLRVLTDQDLAHRLEEGGRNTFDLYFSETVAAKAVVDKALSLVG